MREALRRRFLSRRAKTLFDDGLLDVMVIVDVEVRKFGVLLND